MGVQRSQQAFCLAVTAGSAAAGGTISAKNSFFLRSFVIYLMTL